MSQRIYSLLLLTYYYHKHSLEAMVDAVWWSLVSLLVFGFMAMYLARGSSESEAATILVGFILWDILRLGQDSITLTVLREIWSRNLSNIFTTPLSVKEFFIAQMIMSGIKTLVVTSIMSTIAYYLYGFSITRLSWGLPFYAVNILLFSWAAGIFVLGLLFRFGTRLQALVWSLVVVLQPIAGVFYPISILPNFVQRIALLFPITYIFEASRVTFLTGYVDTRAIITAFVLNALYLTLAIWSFATMFRKAKKTGEFARLEG